MINNYALTVKGRHKHLKQMNGEGEETNETDEKYMIQNEEEKKKNTQDVVSSRSDPTNEKAVNVRHCNTT